MEELNIKNRTVRSRAIKSRFVKPQGRYGESRVSCEMQAKRACVVRGYGQGRKKERTGRRFENDRRERVCGGGGSEKRRAFGRLCDAARGGGP